jgi:uncharacterized membrane protein YfcA
MDPLRVLLLFLGGIAAGFVNVSAGGGSLLTIPLLILYGLPVGVANGTNRVGVLIQNIMAAINFRRHGMRDIGQGLKLGITAMLGAVIGSFIALEIPDSLFQAILAGVMVLGLLVVFRGQKLQSGGDGEAELPWLQLFLFFLIGIYGGFIQAGAGYLVIFSLTVLGGLSLKKTNSLKVIVISLYLAPSLVVYALNGRVEWLPALILAAGTGTGGWLGSTFCVKRGQGWIRVILAIAILGMAGRLAGFY